MEHASYRLLALPWVPPRDLVAKHRGVCLRSALEFGLVHDELTHIRQASRFRNHLVTDKQGWNDIHTPSLAVVRLDLMIQVKEQTADNRSQNNFDSFMTEFGDSEPISELRVRTDFPI